MALWLQLALLALLLPTSLAQGEGKEVGDSPQLGWLSAERVEGELGDVQMLEGQDLITDGLEGVLSRVWGKTIGPAGREAWQQPAAQSHTVRCPERGTFSAFLVPELIKPPPQRA